jgi:hypothetical protein
MLSVLIIQKPRRTKVNHFCMEISFSNRHFKNAEINLKGKVYFLSRLTIGKKIIIGRVCEVFIEEFSHPTLR